MNILKKAIKKSLSTFGYDIVRSNSRAATIFANFENLSKAYEQLLNQSDKNNTIKPNKMRTSLISRLLGTPPSEAYFIIQALFNTRLLDGDVCEFGVAQGETSTLIANEIIDSNKILHLFDSFKGLPQPSKKDKLKDDIFSLGSIEAYAGKMACPEDMVETRLKSISFPSSRYIIHKGFIEELIHVDQDLPQKVSFAYVDFDFYEPIKIALDFLDKVTQRGATIIVDDYDFFSTGVKTAVDEFLNERNSKINSYDMYIPNIQFGKFVILTKKN